jgi:carbamate kinase
MDALRIVIALGGNALQTSNDTASAEEQEQVSERSAEQIVKILADGHDVVVAHGNGPQVGNILIQQERAKSKEVPAMPLDVCGAMSQGMIGYWLQRAFDNCLEKVGQHKPSATIVTQTLVDPTDPAFSHPSKPIGPFYSEEEAKVLAASYGYTLREDAGRGWRRVVPSPEPIEIVEIDTIRKLVEDGYYVIAAGGGGIPVMRDPVDGRLRGVEAVIDKDLGAEKLAEGVNADVLMMLTSVEQVSLFYRTPRQQDLGEVDVSKMRAYMAEGHFAPGSMLPKVEVACRFVASQSGRRAIITSIEKAYDALYGRAGTVIVQ